MPAVAGRWRRAHPHAASRCCGRGPAPSAVNPAPLADRSLIVRLKGDLTADKLTRMYRAADTSAGAVDVVSADVLKWDVPAGRVRRRLRRHARVHGPGRVRRAQLPAPARRLHSARVRRAKRPGVRDETNHGALQTAGHWPSPYRAAKSWWLQRRACVAPSGGNAWRIGYTGANISGKYPLRVDGSEFKVAVIDTGVYLDHPDRSPYMVPGSDDFVPVDPSRGQRRVRPERQGREGLARQLRRRASSRASAGNGTGHARASRTTRWSARTRSTRRRRHLR